MTKIIVRPLNALKTGAYARGDTLLLWESPTEFQKLRAEIFADLQPQRKLERDTVSNIVENRWQRERLRRTTAIATHRHAFGQMLEELGAKSWSDAAKIVRESHIDHHKVLERIANSTCGIAQAAAKWTKSQASEKLEELAGKLVTKCEQTLEELTRIEVALDEEREFFREYSPKQLGRRVRLENSLDAQLDKMMARFINLKEASILRDKLRQPEKTAGLAESHDDVAAASKYSSKAPPPSREGGEKLDLAELDRDDVDVDSAERDRDDDDALAEFVAEDTSRDGGEPPDCAEPDRDDDGTDEWGLPKPPTG